MNIFKRVWNFFRRKKKENRFIPINIFVPTREDLMENGQDQMIKMLDQYKREYREKLKQRLLLGDISSRDLINQYLESQDLILQHVKSNPYLHVDELLASGNTKELFDVKIKYLKLFLLSEENIKLYKEIMLRYAALKEIIDKTTFFSPNKKRAISNEFDFLYNALVVCSSNNFATNKDCQLYLVRIQEINDYLKDTANEDKEYRYDRLSLDTKLASYFAKEAKKQAFGHNMDELGIISYLEVELEKYFYEHKDEFEKLDEGLSEIEAIECTPENKKYLEKMIERLEIKYLLLDRIKGVPKETMTRLYQKKFEILTYGLSLLDENVIDKKDYGYEYYKEIVKDKVDNILSGNNKWFNEEMYNIIPSFKENYTDINNVLLDNHRLVTLLSFDKRGGFFELLSKTMIRKDDFDTVSLFWPEGKMYEYTKCFLDIDGELVWEDKIPLESILKVGRYYTNTMRVDPFFYDIYIYGARTDYYANRFSGTFHLPEGLKKISYRNIDPKKGKFLSFWFAYYNISVPSSLKTIGYRPNHHVNLIFNDFRGSAFLHNKKSVIEFVRGAWDNANVRVNIFDDYGEPIKIDLSSIDLSSGGYVLIERGNEKLEEEIEKLRCTIIHKTGHDIFQDNYQHKGYKVLKKYMYGLVRK